MLPIVFLHYCARGAAGSNQLNYCCFVPIAPLDACHRAALGINPLALRLGRELLAGLGQAGAGNARSKDRSLSATSQEAWPEAESLAMRDSLGREPWWNADRCAPPRWAARPWPAPRHNTDCVCRRFASDISFVLSRSFLFVIRAEAALANASTGICSPKFSMDYRIKVRW